MEIPRRTFLGAVGAAAVAASVPRGLDAVGSVAGSGAAPMAQDSLSKVKFWVAACTPCDKNLKFEEAIYKDIADSRSRLLAAKSPEETIQAANQQTAALGRLLAVVENYPQLKANEQFNRLMDELSGTENRITVERMRYNQRVQEYNAATRSFPGNVTAKMFGFKQYPYFEAPKDAQTAPKVSFGK